MQSSSRALPFNQTLAGASPATDARWPNASCPRSSVRSERQRAKVEVAGAIPAVDAILPLCLRSDRARFVNLFCGRARALDASPTSGSRLKVEGKRQKAETDARRRLPVSFLPSAFP